jgi:hypothetical protein
MLRSESSSRMSIAAVWELLPRRPCYPQVDKRWLVTAVLRKRVPPPLALANYCILAESFGRSKGRRHDKTESVSIGQEVFKSDVGWPRVILSESGSGSGAGALTPSSNHDVPQGCRIPGLVLTTTTGPHVMSSAIDLESGVSGQGAQAMLCTGTFCSRSHHCPFSRQC